MKKILGLCLLLLVTSCSSGSRNNQSPTPNVTIEPVPTSTPVPLDPQKEAIKGDIYVYDFYMNTLESNFNTTSANPNIIYSFNFRNNTNKKIESISLTMPKYFSQYTDESSGYINNCFNVEPEEYCIYSGIYAPTNVTSGESNFIINYTFESNYLQQESTVIWESFTWNTTNVVGKLTNIQNDYSTSSSIYSGKIYTANLNEGLWIPVEITNSGKNNLTIKGYNIYANPTKSGFDFQNCLDESRVYKPGEKCTFWFNAYYTSTPMAKDSTSLFITYNVGGFYNQGAEKVLGFEFMAE